MRAAGKRGGAIEEGASKGDNLAAAFGVVALGGDHRSQGIGAVERVIEAAPTSVGGVQSKPPVRNWHDELRAGDLCDLRINVVGRNLEGFGFGQQITDLAKESGLLSDVQRTPAAIAPPRVNLDLQGVTVRQQLFVARGEVGQDLFKRGPECGGIHTGSRQQLALHKGVQDVVDREGVADVHLRTGLSINASYSPPHRRRTNLAGRFTARKRVALKPLIGVRRVRARRP